MRALSGVSAPKRCAWLAESTPFMQKLREHDGLVPSYLWHISRYPTQASILRRSNVRSVSSYSNPRRLCMTTPNDVLKMIKEKEVKFVDLRFTDTRGKEQHVSVPAKAFTGEKFELGHAFDGSSIAGWKGIQASDMQLMPDPGTANIDPFLDETTLLLTCDVIEPADGKGYERDPRSLAKRAEAYLKSTGVGDVAYFGPEPEFFIFDAVEWSIDMSGSYCKIFSEEAPWSSSEKFESGIMGHRLPVHGGYFLVPTCK